MEQVFQITALCVVGALLAVVVRRGSPELALLLTLAAVAAVLLYLAGALEELLSFLTVCALLVALPLLRAVLILLLELME